jgi:hypothetical protein
MISPTLKGGPGFFIGLGPSSSSGSSSGLSGSSSFLPSQGFLRCKGRDRIFVGESSVDLKIKVEHISSSFRLG